MPAALRPKHVEAAALTMTEQLPLDRLEFCIREESGFGDPNPRPRDP
jgi:hypothetical protein